MTAGPLRSLLWVAAVAALLIVLAAVGVLPRGGPLPWPFTGLPREDDGPEDGGPAADASWTAAPGVSIWGYDVGGRGPAALEPWLQALAPHMESRPLDAYIDPITKGAVPSMDGLRLDAAATLDAIRGAPPGTAVEPAFMTVPAQTALEDLEPAPIWHGRPEKRQAVLLINVAWGEEYLPDLLQVLRDSGVKGTFFFTGHWVDNHRELARQVADEGHEIANHGQEAGADGPGGLGRQDLALHISTAARIIGEATGREIKYFSPHKGEMSPYMGEVARQEGHYLFRWSLDTVDWQDPPRETFVARITEGLHGGALILMHPRQVTVEALPAAVAGIRAAGYEVVTLSELLAPRPPAHLYPRPPEGFPGPEL